MIRIRLTYEQIEAAKTHLQRESLLGWRLALILLDNAAEILMHRELEAQFAFDDHLMPKWEPARTDWIALGHGPKYSANEKQEAERNFRPKTRVLCLRLGRISDEDRQVVDVCHQLRNETFHRGKLREAILERVTKLLYTTVVGLTIKLPARSVVLPRRPASREDASFLNRFGLSDAFMLATDEGRERCATQLLDGVAVDSSLSAVLSDDLMERIDETIGGLEHLSNTSDYSKLDRGLQYTQFWRDVGAELMKNGTREPALEDAFRSWQAQGRATFTLRKIERWRQQAEAISRYRSSAISLGHYWAVDKRLRSLEEEVSEAVWRYDEEIDAQIH
jgi:hypothetical protein